MEFLIDRAASRHDQRTVPGRERLVAAVLPTLRTIADPVRRDGYVQLLARRSGVEERTLLEALRRPESASRPGGREEAHAGSRINLEAVMAQPDALDPRAVERALEPAEATLLRLLLTYPSHVTSVAPRLAEDPFVTTPARELWKALAAAVEGEGERSFDRSAFVAGLEPTLAGVARTLLARTDPLPGGPVEVQQAIDQSLLTLQRARLSERIEFTRARLAEAEAAHDDDELDRLQLEVLELQQRRLALDRAVADTSLLARRRIHPRKTPENVEVAHGDGRL
jgi:DNA primase